LEKTVTASFGAADLERIEEEGRIPIVRTDVVTTSPLKRMDALLDHEFVEHREGQIVPSGRHHFFFLSRTRQSQTKHDGGNPRDAVLPQMPFNQAMWLGTRTEYPGVMRVGERITKSTTLQNIQLKESGQVPFVLLTVRDEISAPSGHAVIEETDLLFGDKPSTLTAPPNGADRPTSPKLEVSLVADAPLLFQFSALAFNSHRIC
jgi:3-methylfumaryl-CoA hydratase